MIKKKTPGDPSLFFLTATTTLLPFMAQQDLVPLRDGGREAHRSERNSALSEVMWALLRGEIAPRAPQQQPQADVAAIAAAAAAAVQAGNRQAAAAASNRLPVSSMSTSCKLCGKVLMVSLVNFDPDRAGLKYCNRTCTSPTVAECSCIEKYMQDNYLGEFHLDCPTPGCPTPFIAMKRVSVIKPSEVPASLWRVCAWLVSSFVIWPLMFYPLLVAISYLSEFIDWHGDPKNFEFPGIPFWTRPPSVGAWVMVTLEEKWLGAIFCYWFWWSFKLFVYCAFQIWPLTYVSKLATKIWYARYRYR